MEPECTTTATDTTTNEPPGLGVPLPYRWWEALEACDALLYDMGDWVPQAARPSTAVVYWIMVREPRIMGGPEMIQARELLRLYWRKALYSTVRLLVDGRYDALSVPIAGCWAVGSDDERLLQLREDPIFGCDTIVMDTTNEKLWIRKSGDSDDKAFVRETDCQ